jgi:hypothetical protein
MSLLIILSDLFQRTGPIAPMAMLKNNLRRNPLANARASQKFYMFLAYTIDVFNFDTYVRMINMRAQHITFSKAN